LFSKNYQPPVKVIYLECTFSECLDHERSKGNNSKRGIVVLDQNSKQLYANIKDIKKFYSKNEKFLSFDANCSIDTLHEKVMSEISPEIIILLGPQDMKDNFNK